MEIKYTCNRCKTKWKGSQHESNCPQCGKQATEWITDFMDFSISTNDIKLIPDHKDCCVDYESQCKCYEEQLKNKDATIEELRSVIKILSKQLK